MLHKTGFQFNPRTISNGQSVSSVNSVSSVVQSLPSAYQTHGTAADRYADANLTPGVINDTLFDATGRQYAALGHPLPASEVGLSGTNYDSTLVRIRTETVFNSAGQGTIQRSGLAQVETTDGTYAGVFDADSVDSKMYSADFGNTNRTESITGGTITHNADTDTTFAPMAAFTSIRSHSSAAATDRLPKCSRRPVMWAQCGTLL